jgi:hypothetical protein
MSKVVLLRLHETKETEGWIRERQQAFVPAPWPLHPLTTPNKKKKNYYETSSGNPFIGMRGNHGGFAAACARGSRFLGKHPNHCGG